MESSDGGDPKKLFVGGIPSWATKETVINYFSQFGDLVGADIHTHSTTGKPRGFCFVCFQNLDSVQLALDHVPHIIQGKTVEVKRAKPKSRGASTRNNWLGLSKKIFVGGLPQDCTNEELKEHFESFGPVVDAFVVVNSHTGKNRGFGFVTFESYAAADNAIKSRSQLLKNKLIEVKPAERKTTYSDSPNNLPTTSNGRAVCGMEGLFGGHDVLHQQYYNHNGYYIEGVSPGYTYNMAQYGCSQQNYDYTGWGAGYPMYLPVSTFNYPHPYCSDFHSQPFYNAHGYLGRGLMGAARVHVQSSQQNEQAGQPPADQELTDEAQEHEQPPRQNGSTGQTPAEELTDAAQAHVQPPQQNGQADLLAEQELPKTPGGSSSEHVLSPKDPAFHDRTFVSNSNVEYSTPELSMSDKPN